MLMRWAATLFTSFTLSSPLGLKSIPTRYSPRPVMTLSSIRFPVACIGGPISGIPDVHPGLRRTQWPQIRSAHCRVSPVIRSVILTPGIDVLRPVPIVLHCRDRPNTVRTRGETKDHGLRLGHHPRPELVPASHGALGTNPRVVRSLEWYEFVPCEHSIHALSDRWTPGLLKR